MFPILDSVIGVGFVFSLLSLVCSAIREAGESVVRKRSTALKVQLHRMLGEKTAEALYRHPLIASLGEHPDYISPRAFSLVVADLVRTGERLALGGDPEAIEVWFNSSMDSLSRAYRRYTHVWLAVIGLTVTIVMNADFIRILSAYQLDPALRNTSVTVAQRDLHDQTTVGESLSELRSLGLPIGWTGGSCDNSLPWKAPWTGNGWRNAWLLIRWHAAGWLLTVGAISLGAPFWFDLTKRLLPLRG